MSVEEKVYRDLQKHLDKQAVGFPATKSGVELRILKHLFAIIYLTQIPKVVE